LNALLELEFCFHFFVVVLIPASLQFPKSENLRNFDFPHMEKKHFNQEKFLHNIASLLSTNEAQHVICSFPFFQKKWISSIYVTLLFYKLSFFKYVWMKIPDLKMCNKCN
jgi:hypothetical protein